MATSKHIVRPVIFLMGCKRNVVARVIGNSNEYTLKLFGVEPLFVCRESYRWLLSPKDDDFERLERLKPAFHNLPAEEWVHLNSFNDFVRQYLRDEVTDEFGCPVDPRHVRMVVCSGLHSTEEAFKVERLLAEVFPDAILRENPNSASILQPLVRDVKVEDLGLSTLASSGLVRHGIYTLGMLRQKSKAELSAIPGIGRKSINKIQELLEESRRGGRL